MTHAVAAPWKRCPDGVPFVVCLGREDLIAIRVNQKTELADRDRMLVDERERAEKAEAQRDAATAERDRATVAGWAGGTAGAVLAAALAVVVTWLAVHK